MGAPPRPPGSPVAGGLVVLRGEAGVMASTIAESGRRSILLAWGAFLAPIRGRDIPAAPGFPKLADQRSLPPAGQDAASWQPACSPPSGARGSSTGVGEQ